MQIMLTNDDGVYAYGILALAKALQAQGGHQIHIVAPDREQSGTAHSFTFLTPLHAEPVRLEGLENGDAFWVSGTPTDCVKVGVSNLLADKPDCIISGINHGQNLGIDTTYSGTVSAALEGALLGIPSMAVSLVGSMRKLGDKKQAYFDAAANIAASLLPRFLQSGSLLWNVNIPALPQEQIRGVRFTPLARQIYDGTYVEREDPRDRRYFWTPVSVHYTHDTQTDCDIRWIQEGYIAITPLVQDMTDYPALQRMQNEAE